MLAWENGLRHMTNAKRPIITPDDLKGLKMRVPQSDVLLEAFKAFGAEAATLPLPLLFEALRAGKFDGQENPIATIRAAEHAPGAKIPDPQRPCVYDPAVFLMSPDAFDDLSAEDKVSFKGGRRSRRQGLAHLRCPGADRRR